MKIRATLAQIAPRLGDVSHNLRLHQEYIRQAKEDKQDLIIFPEMGITGYMLQDLTLDAAMKVTDERITDLVQASQDIDIVFSFVEETPAHSYTISGVYASGGHIHHIHRKVYLPTYGMFDEMRYFGRGQQIRAFDTRFGKMGLLICEDSWHPSASTILTQDGAEIIIVIASGPARGAMDQPTLGSEQSWHQMLRTYSSIYGTFYLFVNRVGVEDGVSFFGRSAIFDPYGQQVAVAPFLEEALLNCELDLRMLRRARYTVPLIRDEDVALTIREMERIQKEGQR